MRMQPNLIEGPSPIDPAEPFALMAGQISHNTSAAFGGAFVIVPPGGDSITTLILDPSKSLAQFWSLVKAKAELALADLETKERNRWRGMG